MELGVGMEDPAQPEIVNLLEDGERYSARIYPAESNHHLPLVALLAANIRFLVARDGDGRAVGNGALALFRSWAELKRMWVVPRMRGRGVSKLILEALEAKALEEDVRCLRLETGIETMRLLRCIDAPASRDAIRSVNTGQTR